MSELSSPGPDRHAPEYEVEGRLLLDVVIAQGTTILELFAGEDEALLVWRNAVYARNF